MGSNAWWVSFSENLTEKQDEIVDMFGADNYNLLSAYVFCKTIYEPYERFGLKSAEGAEGSSISLDNVMEDIDALVLNSQYKLNILGEDEYYNELETAIGALGEQADKAQAILQKIIDSDNKYLNKYVEKIAPGFAAGLVYTDSEEDKMRKAEGLVPASFDPDSIAAELVGYETPEMWDDYSVGELLDTVEKRGNIKKLNEQYDNPILNMFGADKGDPLYVVGGTDQIINNVETYLQDNNISDEELKYIVFIRDGLNRLPENIKQNLDMQRAGQMVKLIGLVNSDDVYAKAGEAIAGDKQLSFEQANIIGRIDDYLTNTIAAKRQQAQTEAGNKYGSLQIQLKSGFMMDTTTGFISDKPVPGTDLNYYTSLPSSEVINEIISKQMMNVSLGQGYDESQLNLLQQYGLGEVADFIRSKKQGDYFVITGDVKDSYLDTLVQAYATQTYNEKQEKNLADITSAATADKDFAKYVEIGKQYNDGGRDHSRLLNYINHNETPEYLAIKNSIVYGGGGPALGKMMAAANDPNRKYDHLKPEEADVIRYLYAKGDHDALNTYLNSIERVLTARVKAKQDESIAKMSGLEAAVMSIMTAPAQGASWLGAGIHSLGNAISGEWTPIDPNSNIMLVGSYSGRTREKALEGTEGLGRTLAELGFSAADMAVLLPLGPGAMPVIMASEAGGATANDIIARGGTPEQAFIGGSVAALTEYFTEKLPINKLFRFADDVKLGKLTTREILKGIGIQATTEAGEELVSGIAQTLEDIIIMGDKSQFSLRVKELMASGMSRMEAERQAWGETAVDWAKQAGGGFLLGGVFGGGAVGINSFSSTSSAKNVVDDIRTNIQQNVKAPVSPFVEGKQQNIQVQNSGNVIPVLPKAEENIPATYTPDMLNERLQSKIQENIQSNPETVKSALTEGMTALAKIETRIKADSKNINRQSIDIEASHNAYMDFNTERGVIENNPIKAEKLRIAAETMVSDIKAAVKTGELIAPELVKLQGIITELTGDADLTGAYLSRGIDINIKAEANVDENTEGNIDSNSENIDNIVQETNKYIGNIGSIGEPNKEILTDGSQLQDGKLKPDITYKTGEHDYIYRTNEDGLIIEASTDNLKFKTHKGRLSHNTNTFGKAAGDQAGHLFGDRFGGSPELDNLISQAQRVNQSEFKIIENQWATALENGEVVTVDISINYEKGNARPISFDIYYTIDGAPFYTSITN